MRQTLTSQPSSLGLKYQFINTKKPPEVELKRTSNMHIRNLLTIGTIAATNLTQAAEKSTSLATQTPRFFLTASGVFMMTTVPASVVTPGGFSHGATSF